MKVLALDTSTQCASIAVVETVDGRLAVLAEREEPSGNHSDNLIDLIGQCLEQSGTNLSELDGICIGAGPGSFTGLRIGMATAKGLAFASGRPLWAVSSLAALAQQAPTTAATTGILAVVDAKRKEVFVGAFRPGHVPTPVAHEHVVKPADLAGLMASLRATLGDDIVIVGDGLSLYPEHVQPLGQPAPGARQTPSAVGVAAVAIASKSGDQVASAVPLYVRPSEAEIKFPKGNTGGTFASFAKKPTTE